MSRKQYSQANGQVDVFGKINGLDKFISPPEVIEVDGLRVIRVVIPDKERETSGYVETALKQARALLPEVKSQGKPPWMDAEWQARRRKKRATR